MEQLIEGFEEINGPKQDTKAGSSTSTSSETKKERDPAHFWLNVGVERGGKLISLPMGIPLDKLKAKPVPNKTSEFQQLRAAEKALWEQFRPFYESLKPGESKRINFICEVRRINEAEAVIEEENPFSVGKLSFS